MLLGDVHGRGRRGGPISASRRVEAPSLLQYDSCLSHNEVGGFFFDFGANSGRSAQVTYNLQDERELAADGFEKLPENLLDLGFGDMFIWVKKINRC